MKLRASNIVYAAVERAVDGAVPYAFRRWWKYRESGDGAALTDSREFIDHVVEHVRGAVTEALSEILDFESSDQADEVPLKSTMHLEVYQGGGGWRWSLHGPAGVLSTSVYHSTHEKALGEAFAIARETGLRIVPRFGETGPTT